MPFAHHLVIVRHAKAAQTGDSDFERALTSGGQRDAVSAGAWLRDRDVRPSTGLVSAARRAQETWQALSSGAGWTLAPTTDEGLYTAGPDTALDVLRLQDDAARTLVMVGHNPTMSYLANLLDDGECDPSLAATMVTGFPTCALAVFGYDGSWADLATGAARLLDFHVGRAD